MKYVLSVLFILVALGVCSQQTFRDNSFKSSSIDYFPPSNYFTSNISFNLDTIYMEPRAGSCSSPDGSMSPTITTPPSYAWLQTNGYCNPNSYGTNPTVCWTFTPTSSSININSGYSVSGCVNVSFGPFTLYNASCTVVGSGINFTGLTPGVQYTWCMTASASGGGPGCTGFDDFCPYYFNNIVLPVELIEFRAEKINNKNLIKWVTASETNNDYFTLEKSTDGENWFIITVERGEGTTSDFTYYQFLDVMVEPTVNYYRLSQTDYNGYTESFNPIVVDNTIDTKNTKLIKIINLMGQEVNETYKGIRVYLYEDGSFIKKF